VSSRFYVHLSLGVAVVCLLTSCAADRSRSASSSNVVRDAAPPLLQIEEAAEQIVATVPSGDWPRIYASIQDINDTWRDYAASSIGPGPQSLPVAAAVVPLRQRLVAAMDALRDAAFQRDPGGTMRAANDVSAAAADFYGYYHPAIPPDLPRLAGLERQVLIDLSAEGYDAALATLNNAERLWEGLLPTILSRAGAKATDAVAGQLQAQRTALIARDRAQLTASVNTALSLIRGIQRLY
jgi:hypothetical protein